MPYVQRSSIAGARAGNINELLPRMSSELVVLLAAGQVPMPDLLTATDRYFDDPDVAVVVCGSRDASRARITHSADDRHEQALDSEVTVPSLDRSGRLPLGGGACRGAARNALIKVGGLATQTQTPEYLTGLRLQRRGKLVRHHAETLCETHGPQSVEALMRIRERSTRGRWSTLRTADSPVWAGGLSIGARLGHASLLIRPTMAIQKVVMIAVLIVTLLTGALPLQASVYELAFLAVPYLVLGGAGRVILGRGRLEPGDWTKQDLRYLGVHLTAMAGALFGSSSRFRYVPREATTEGGVAALSKLRFLTGLLIALVAAMAFRTVAVSRDPGSLRGLALLVVFALAGWLVVQMMDVLGMLSRHRQRRRRFRVLTDMQAVLDDTIVNVLDISPLGMGLETAHRYDRRGPGHGHGHARRCDRLHPDARTEGHRAPQQRDRGTVHLAHRPGVHRARCRLVGPAHLVLRGRTSVPLAASWGRDSPPDGVLTPLRYASAGAEVASARSERRRDGMSGGNGNGNGQRRRHVAPAGGLRAGRSRARTEKAG